VAEWQQDTHHSLLFTLAPCSAKPSAILPLHTQVAGGGVTHVMV
jgi:hypothetical protein